MEKKKKKYKWDWLFWLIIIGIVFIVSFAVYSSQNTVSSPKQSSTTTQQHNPSNQNSKQPSNSDSSGLKMQINGKGQQDLNGIKVTTGSKQNPAKNN